MEITEQELKNEVDMLKGNINRMMITDDLEELRTMYDYAKERLEIVYKARCNILRERAMLKIREKIVKSTGF